MQGQKNSLTRHRFDLPSRISDQQHAVGHRIAGGEPDRPAAAEGALPPSTGHRLRQGRQACQGSLKRRLRARPPPQPAGQGHADIGDATAEVGDARVQPGAEM